MNQTSRCKKCGDRIELKQVAFDAFTHEPVFRWLGPRKPNITCSVTNLETGGRHVPESSLP